MPKGIICLLGDMVWAVSFLRVSQCSEREKLLYAAGRCIMESRELVLQAVKKRWDSLREVDEVWKSDREVVLAAVREHMGCALEFAAEALKGDREIVLAAVQESGQSLKHASEALRGDRDVVLAALQSKGTALIYATEALRADREV
eukprot:902422-Amphidinium_carterae.1